MRYYVLQPSSPVDPRELEFASLMDLRRELPIVAESDLESDAVDEVRRRYPNALAMPVPVDIGSGTTLLLGIVAGDARIDAGRSIPFVLFVHAVPESGRDKRDIVATTQYSRTKWRLPVLRPPEHPAEVGHHQVSIRASDLDQFAAVDATTFRRDARQVIYVQVGDAEMSLEFQDPTIRISASQSQCDDLKKVRERNTPFAIGLRMEFVRGSKTYYDVFDGTGAKVGDLVSICEQRQDSEWRHYVPTAPPPDHPGVVAIVHPAAWSYGGPEMVDGLVKRFGREVNVFAHGSRWLTVFMESPGDDYYTDHNCQWWARARMDGGEVVWTNMAAS